MANTLSEAEQRIVNQFTKDELLMEAETVEDCGEWLHMSLMGYKPEDLRRLAEFCQK